MTDRWWLRPLVAAVLGALPFLVFVGTSQTSTVNGETVLDSQFNILGLVLAVIGIGVAVATLRRRPRPAAIIAAILAVLVCLAGAASSLDLLPRGSATAQGPERPAPPPLPPAGLDDRTRELERQYFAEGPESELRNELMRMATLAIIGAVEHERYATACWPDDVRLTEAEARAAVPALLTPAERAGVEDTSTRRCRSDPAVQRGGRRGVHGLPGGYRPQRPGPADTAGRAVPGPVRRLSSASLLGLAATVEGSRA